MSSPRPFPSTDTQQQQVFPTGGTIPSSGGPHQQQQLAVSNGVLLAAVIFLFMVVVFVFLLYLYAKRYLGASPLVGPPSSRFIFVDASPLASRGLPAAVLRALPVTVYAKKGAAEEEEPLECAVCLSEVAEGEKVRALPKCGHGFHVECIDMWFHSHDTCPLCRAAVAVEAAAPGGLPRVPREEPEPALEFPMFPTNVLFWGTHDDVTNAVPPPPPPPPRPPVIATAASSSSSASGRRKENLVIDIPTRGVAVTSSPRVMTSSASPATTPRPASRMPGADEMRSPVSARLRSLCRLLSRGKQAVAGTSSSSSSHSPRGDIEQGFAGPEAAPRPPKTPKTPPPSTH